MFSFIADFFVFLWDMRHWAWRLLAFGVVIGGLSIIFRMIDAEDMKKVDLATVHLPGLETVDIFHGEINVPVNYTATEPAGFVARPYKLVLYKGERQDLVVTGVTDTNEVWRFTVKVARRDFQAVGLTQATQGEGNTAIDVHLGPSPDGTGTKWGLLVFGLMAMLISFLVFRPPHL